MAQRAYPCSGWNVNFWLGAVAFDSGGGAQQRWAANKGARGRPLPLLLSRVVCALLVQWLRGQVCGPGAPCGTRAT